MLQDVKRLGTVKAALSLAQRARVQPRLSPSPLFLPSFSLNLIKRSHDVIIFNRFISLSFPVSFCFLFIL